MYEEIVEAEVVEFEDEAEKAFIMGNAEIIDVDANIKNDLNNFPAVVEKKPNSSSEEYDWKEQELIQELIALRQQHNSQLVFEDLEGYEIPPRTQFSMLCKPAVSIKYRKLQFNTSAVRLMKVLHVVPSFHPEKHRIAILPCNEEEYNSVQWSRIKDDSYVPKEITSEEFVESIFSRMGWDRNCRFKALGHVAKSKRGIIMVFDLNEAIQYAALPTEYKDPFTGNMKKRRQAYYPDMYKGRVGKSYKDYEEESHQINMFEYLEGYTGKTYSDMPSTEETANIGEVVVEAALQG